MIRPNLTVSPELAGALRNEIRTVLEAGGRPFDSNIARRVYDLAHAASDLCLAATDTDYEVPPRRYLTKLDERSTVSPLLAEALRAEIRAALEANGDPFDVNVARRVYDLAIAARDMCVAATGSVKEAIDQIKDTNGPMETLDATDTPESQLQASESFGARLLRELMATLTLLQGSRGEGSRGEDPKQLVHALAEARRNGMHDVAEQLEVKLFGRVLSGPRPIAAEEIVVVEGSYEQGYADGLSGTLPMHSESGYHEGYLKGTEAKFLDNGYPPSGATGVVIEPCVHPTEALYEAPYDDGYQVFCRVCGKHVRLGNLVASERSQQKPQDDGHAGRKHPRPPSGMENAFDEGGRP